MEAKDLINGSYRSTKPKFSRLAGIIIIILVIPYKRIERNKAREQSRGSEREKRVGISPGINYNKNSQKLSGDNPTSTFPHNFQKIQPKKWTFRKNGFVRA